MRRIGGVRHVSACQLVLALRAGLDADQSVLNGEVDGLIITDLEMQERVVLGRAPVAAVEGVAADEVDGAGDPAAGALGHHQEDAVGHRRAGDGEEFARQIGPAPFARAGVHVELEEGVPHAFGQVRAGQPVHLDAGRERVLALAANALALARGEAGEEVVEAGVAVILPVELLVGALQEAARAERGPFRLGEEGDVRGRQIVAARDFGETVGQRALHGGGEGAGAGEQARAGDRCEGHRDLELGIVIAAGTLIGLGPALVEDIFALRVGLHIAGCGAEQGAVGRLRQQMARLPASAVADRM